MSVKVYFPKVPDNEDDFIKYLNRHCENKARFVKNKDGNRICILTISFDENIQCANDLIDNVYGQILGDTVLKPKIHVDSQILRILDSITFPPPSGDEDQVFTTHVEGKYYYVQLMNENDQKSYLYNYMKNLYKEFTAGNLKPVAHELVVVDKIYGATYENDGTFHRMQVLSKLPDKMIRGYYLDFGNIEDVHVSKVIDLDEEYKKMIPLAHKCTLDGIEIIDNDKHLLISQELVNRRSKARLVKQLDEKLHVERVVYIDYPEFSTITYREYLVGRGAAKISNGSMSNESKGESKTVKNGKFSNHDELYRRAMIAHYESLTEFYVLMDDSETETNLPRINSIIGKLQMDIKNAPPYQDDNSMYLTTYSIDGNYYRCVVLQNNSTQDTSSNSILVQFIDFGNCEWKKDSNELKLISNKWNTLAAELASIEPCAVKCSFEDELVYNLQCAGLGKIYFQENFVNNSQPVKLLCTPKPNGESNSSIQLQMFIVSNIMFENGSDLITEYDKVTESTSNSERYHITAIHSLQEIWFTLFKSYSRVVQKNIEDVRRVCKDPHLYPEIVDNPVMDDLYLVSHDNMERRIRGKFIGSDRKNTRYFFRDIDTGFMEIIKPDQVYKIPQYIADIEPFAKPYRMKVRSKYSEAELVKNIRKAIAKNEVSLRLENDDLTIVDIIIKGRSIIKSLIRQGYIERETKLPDLLEESFNDILKGLKPDKGETIEIDFDLPSIEHISNVPSEVKLKKAKISVLRLTFTEENRDSHLNGFAKFRESTKDSKSLIEIVNQVDTDKKNYLEVLEELKEVCCSPNIRRKCLDDLIVKRDELSKSICKLYDDFDEKMKHFGDEPVNNEILDDLRVFMDNLCFVFDVPSQNTSITAAKSIDEIIEDITKFLKSESYANIVEIAQDLKISTQESIEKLKTIFESMFKDYRSNEDIAKLSDSVPLVDTIYNVNTQLTKEYDNYLSIKNNEELLNILQNTRNFLESYFVDVEKVKAAFEVLENLKQTCDLVMADYKDVVEKIESNNVLLLNAKKELRWAKVNLEDAEDTEDSETIKSATLRLDKASKDLHECLRKSSELIDNETKMKLIHKNELQILNQSLILHEEEAPIFLWDFNYFVTKECNLEQDIIVKTSYFENEPIKIQQIAFPHDSLLTYLQKFHRVHIAANDEELCVKLVPIMYSFLSKSDIKHHFVIYNNYKHIDDIPDNIELNLIRLLNICHDMLMLMTQLWHHGYIYAESDFDDGFFLQLEAHTDLDELNTLYLPLPLQAIIINEIGKDSPHLSINSLLTKFYKFISMNSKKCIEILRESESNKTITELFERIPVCKDISSVESLIDDLCSAIKQLKQKEVELNKLNEEMEQKKLDDSVTETKFESNNSDINEVEEEENNDVIINGDVDLDKSDTKSTKKLNTEINGQPSGDEVEEKNLEVEEN